MTGKTIGILAFLAACGIATLFVLPREVPSPATVADTAELPKGHARATFAGGCFWCTEAVFLELKGVQSVVSGYTGGHVKNPTYRQVCSKTTGHAEAIQVVFDPALISYDELLDIFFHTHDPTTLDQQGADVGPQYRSAIFTHSAEQKAAAERVKRTLDDSGEFRSPIVTEIVPASTFYRAEPEHQDFFRSNPEHGYCRAVIRSKVEKVRAKYADKLK